MDHKPTMAFLHQLAAVSRKVVVPYFGQPLNMERKDDDSPVTRADREAEQAIRELIEAQFPDHGIFGEEFGVKTSDSQYQWVIDPIDGTKSFITGKPLFGTLIALLEDGSPIMGAADMPILGRRWTGERGAQTTEGGAPCKASGLEDLAQARLASTNVDMFEGADVQRYEALTREVWFRNFGGDLYLYLMVASGHLDLVVEAQLAPYDILALVPIVEGAGGVISDWNGEPLTLDSDGKVLASGSIALHERALGFLQ